MIYDYYGDDDVLIHFNQNESSFHFLFSFDARQKRKPQIWIRINCFFIKVHFYNELVYHDSHQFPLKHAHLLILRYVKFICETLTRNNKHVFIGVIIFFFHFPRSTPITQKVVNHPSIRYRCHSTVVNHTNLSHANECWNDVQL